SARAGATKEGLDREIKDKHGREAAVAHRYNQIKDANKRRDQLKEAYHQSRARYTSLQEIDAGATDVAGDVKKLRSGDPDAGQALRGLLADFIAFNAAAAELPPRAAAAFERWSERVLVDGLDAFNILVRASHKLGLGTMPAAILSQFEAVNP